MTYDLRRLRAHGLIERIPHTHRYQVTDHGLHTAMFLTRLRDRLIPTGLAHLANQSTPDPLRRAATAYQNAIDNLTNATGLTA
jgi:DNA-binding GntR family transcriptional regulator